MNRTPIARLALPLLLVGGCVVHSTAHTEPVASHAEVEESAAPPPSAAVRLAVGEPTVATGVEVVQVSCAQGAQEACNGLDDDCDGQIDEGCGYSSGNIQITLFWSGGADIDMYVTDPSGETIHYAHPRSASGGHLDHDARGACRGDQENNTIENVYWPTEQPPTGTYQVDLHYWGECSSGAGVTQTTLSIAVGGQLVGSYSYILSPNERVTVASFTL